ncbi:hypothetical protein BC833DRAFT_142853 [Globomyces pollinis-pini]|nr:hypothetical protein BC833DRAFT_142853 [Globomyces pollinis-pini]
MEKVLKIIPGVPVKVGRKVSPKTLPDPSNAYFDSKVLSRSHAEITADKNIIYIQDLKSSNGTFVNGVRLSDEGVLSDLRPLKANDILDFGVDIKDEEGKVLYFKVSAKVNILSGPHLYKTPSTQTIHASNFVKPSDQITLNRNPNYGSDEYLSIIEDEKTLSYETAETLKKIQSSFEAIERNTLSKLNSKQQIQPDVVQMFSSLNEKLTNIDMLVHKHDDDLESLIPQESTLKSSLKSFELTQQEHEKLLKEFQNSFAEETKTMQNTLIEAIEKSMKNIQDHANLEELENKRLNGLVVTLRDDLKDVTIALQSEKDRNEKLQGSLDSFRKLLEQSDKKYDQLENKLEKFLIASKDQKLNELNRSINTSNDRSSDRTSYFNVVLITLFVGVVGVYVGIFQTELLQFAKQVMK